MLTLVVLIVVVAAVGAIVCACAAHRNKAAAKQQYANAGVDEFEQMIARTGVQLVDVRTLEEFNVGHLAGATLIDVKQSDFTERALATLDKAMPVAVYCRSGRRSANAAAVLAANGYRVTNLEGGILAWQAAQKPTTTK